jgi:hypothetical protein
VLTLPSAMTSDRPAVVAEIRAFVARLRDMQAARLLASAETPVAVPASEEAEADAGLPAVKTPAKARPAAGEGASRPAGASPLAAAVPAAGSDE